VFPWFHAIREEEKHMLSPNRRRFGGVIFAVALIPGSAGAQTAAHSFEDLQRMLKVRETVVVSDESGRQVKGKVEKLSSHSITVGGRTFSDAVVTEIRLLDPLWNGMLIGAAIGTGLATWDYMIDPSEPGNAVIFTAAIGIGSALGAGVDALRKKGGRLLYAWARPRTEIRLLPLLERDRRGALLYIRF
jgi:hypothetical protein